MPVERRLNDPTLADLETWPNGCNDVEKCHKCAGDCETDEDCKSGLKCFQRSASTSLVPGCASGGDGDFPKSDYCFDPADVPTGVSTYQRSSMDEFT